MHHGGHVLALERGGLGVDLLQMLGIVVELERIGRRDERPIHEMRFHHAAQLAPEAQAAFGQRLAMPAALGLLGERIEALGDIGGRGLRLLASFSSFGSSAPAIAACSTMKRG